MGAGDASQHLINNAATYRARSPTVSRQLDLFQQTYGADSPRLCFPLWQSIPLLLDSQQEFRALAAAQRCLTLASPEGARPVTHASALNNLALVYQRTGSLALAVGTSGGKRGRSSSKLPITPLMMSTETRQPPHLNIRANLGLAYWQQGDVMPRIRANISGPHVQR